MMSRAPKSGPQPVAAPLFDPRLVTALTVLGFVLFIGYLLLVQFLPQWRLGRHGEPSGLGNSAIGYAGFFRLLERLDIPVVHYRQRDYQGLPQDALVVMPVTDSSYIRYSTIRAGSRLSLGKLKPHQDALLVLPRWYARDTDYRGWLRKYTELTLPRTVGILNVIAASSPPPAPPLMRPDAVGDPSDTDELLNDQPPAIPPPPAPKPPVPDPVLERAKNAYMLTRTSPPPTYDCRLSYPAQHLAERFAMTADPTHPGYQALIRMPLNGLGVTDGLQLRCHDRLLLTTLHLQADRSSRKVFVLFDPGLIANLRLGDRATMAMMVQAFQAMRGDRPVVFDETLIGPPRDPDLWTAAFTPPMLAPTLVALLLLALALWHALPRFGRAEIEAAGLRHSKQLLIDNTAALLGVKPDYRHLAQGYREGQVLDLALTSGHSLGTGAGRDPHQAARHRAEVRRLQDDWQRTNNRITELLDSPSRPSAQDWLDALHDLHQTSEKIRHEPR